MVLTSNVGAARITAKGSKLGFSATERRDGETRPIEELKAAVLDDLKKVFRPEFLNRLDETIVFTQLGRTEIQGHRPAHAGTCGRAYEGSGGDPPLH